MRLTLFDDRLHDRERYLSLDDSKRQACRVEIKASILVWANTNEPVSTTGFIGKSTRQNQAISNLAAYAVDESGALYIHEHRSPESHPHAKPGEFFSHASFFDGGAGLCFGMICVEDGIIEYIDNESGHYRPSPHHLDQLLLRIPTTEECEVVLIDMDSDCESEDETEQAQSQPQSQPQPAQSVPSLAAALCQLGITASRQPSQENLLRSHSINSVGSVIDHGPPTA